MIFIWIIFFLQATSSPEHIVHDKRSLRTHPTHRFKSHYGSCISSQICKFQSCKFASLTYTIFLWVHSAKITFIINLVYSDIQLTCYWLYFDDRNMLWFYQIMVFLSQLSKLLGRFKSESVMEYYNMTCRIAREKFAESKKCTFRQRYSYL